ncbi:MAG: lipopolysaccharide heptosyltransferase family protein [Cyanobacteriota bacterium]|nr:lipopolysaccharide heptosyltransferase family protein [Cyanobacteriota bacterium]
MRALFLIPGDAVRQLQALPAVAACAEQLGFAMQVACDPKLASLWTLLPAVEKVLPFSFESASLADWANLMGSVREPDFQACINLARGRQVDLMLSMSHIPNRIAAAGFSATSTVTPASGGWPAQALAAYLEPIGVTLQAEAFRLRLPAEALQRAKDEWPPGDGPLLLLAPAGGTVDWPADRWAALPPSIGSRLPNLRHRLLPPTSGGSALERAALVASADVVLASDPITQELALLCGVPLVALGRASETLPTRQGLRAVGVAGDLASLAEAPVLQALGLG